MHPDQLLETYFNLRREMKELAQREEYYKEKLHQLLDEHQTNGLQNADYRLTRTFQMRETLSKKDVPADVWQEYAKTTEFPVLHLKPQ